jgi:hypothetical protein
MAAYPYMAFLGMLFSTWQEPFIDRNHACNQMWVETYVNLLKNYWRWSYMSWKTIFVIFLILFKCSKTFSTRQRPAGLIFGGQKWHHWTCWTCILTCLTFVCNISVGFGFLTSSCWKAVRFRVLVSLLGSAETKSLGGRKNHAGRQALQCKKNAHRSQIPWKPKLLS